MKFIFKSVSFSSLRITSGQPYELVETVLEVPYTRGFYLKIIVVVVIIIWARNIQINFF